MKILAFAASLRKDSYNRRLIRLAADIARDSGAEIALCDFHEFDMPLYDGDREASEGIPAGAQALIAQLEAADAFIISSPEYNFSMPGTIKNAIDWVSRKKPVPFRGKSGLLLSASPSVLGGNRALWQLRVPLEALGAYIYPDMFSLPQAHQAFDEEGRLKDPAMKERLENMAGEFVKWAASHEALKFE